ncbi:hypothetical protein H0H81_003051, partial [Sphagnurus paluster]
MAKMAQTRVDPEIDNWHTVNYTSVANTCFLGIWEAAEGEEFVVGSNSFGMWEGLVGRTPGLHRLFVVIPKIALVLRHTSFEDKETIDQIKSQTSVLSNLIDIPMTVASSTYVNYRNPSWSNDQEQEAANQALPKCHQTPAAQEDIFTFKATRLMQEQTHALNSVILLHLSDDGNVTFASAAAMKNTMQHHLQSTIPYAGVSKYSFRNLLGILSDHVGHTSSTASNPVIPRPPPGIDLVLHSIASGVIKFHSEYDRGYRVYHLATDDITKYNQSSSEIHGMTVRGIAKMKEILPPLPCAHRHNFNVLRYHEGASERG